jgi:hypothetical protein
MARLTFLALSNPESLHHQVHNSLDHWHLPLVSAKFAAHRLREIQQPQINSSFLGQPTNTIARLSFAGTLLSTL